MMSEAYYIDLKDPVNFFSEQISFSIMSFNDPFKTSTPYTYTTYTLLTFCNGARLVYMLDMQEVMLFILEIIKIIMTHPGFII